MQPQGGGVPPEALPKVKHFLAVASGKGGVGKSTVAVNLALALHQQGHRVGLMDADIYGPSIPTMLGVGPVDQRTTPLPLEHLGIKLMSMGFVMEVSQAAILRGPMVQKYFVAFLTQLRWGELDYLVIDMPPGTGDAQLALAQTTQAMPSVGVIVVTMPQDLSLTVARRGIEMFRHVRVPVIGVVENMSYFLGADGQRYEIFRQGGGRKLADAAGIPFLGEIPIDSRVAECSDKGCPIVIAHPDSEVTKAYNHLASCVDREIAKVQSQPELPGLQL
jgi:ATP-binding protein involved in chromosome partitioning